MAGPGFERARGTEYRSVEWSAIFRVGGFYEFPLSGGRVLSPAVFYDFTDGHDNTFVYGFNVGRSF